MGLFPMLADELGPLVQEAADGGVMVGTSSWKYPGWIGQLYDAGRYAVRGRLAQTKFERECLSEYAEVFRTVCVDATYYRFPDREMLEGLAGQVPDGFRFGFKVTSEVTVKDFPKLPRYGVRGGRENPDFLNAELFRGAFLGPCASIREKVGILMFEFSHFHPGQFARGREFVERLDGFLGELPTGWRYGVEIRNRTFLHPEYFAVLRRHGVVHVYNQWTDMPPVAEQMAMAGSGAADGVAAARFLLTPGREYEAAVSAFSPYRETKEIDAGAREAGARLVVAGMAPRKPGSAWIYVNNRLEGSALQTIRAMLLAARMSRMASA
jgi:uncharacterized protein YecE (DUF72 family)